MTDLPGAKMSTGVELTGPMPPWVSAERILRLQGYSHPGRVRPAIRRAAERVVELAAETSAPEVVSRRLAIAGIRGATLTVDGSVCFHCEAFAMVLSGCTEAEVFVLTLGPKLDARVLELTQRGELLDALLLESAGWLCVEEATRRLTIALRSKAHAAGRRITSRMGPGHSYKSSDRMCTWPLEEQIAFFQLFRGVDLPVRVLPSGAMLPKMSRSGLYGIAPLPPAAR